MVVCITVINLREGGNRITGVVESEGGVKMSEYSVLTYESLKKFKIQKSQIVVGEK